LARPSKKALIFTVLGSTLGAPAELAIGPPSGLVLFADQTPCPIELRIAAGRAERFVRVIDRLRQFGFTPGISAAAMAVGCKFPANSVGGLAPESNVRYLCHVVILRSVPPAGDAGFCFSARAFEFLVVGFVANGGRLFKRIDLT
jgi:hypothetical protein